MMPVSIGLAILKFFGLSDRIAKKVAPLALAVLALLLIGAALLAFNLWLDNEREKAVEADRARSSAEAVSRAREADQDAQRAAQGTSNSIEAGNKRASEAARDSDDPLAAGLEKLREER